jgi:hypothetical protein
MRLMDTAGLVMFSGRAGVSEFMTLQSVTAGGSSGFSLLRHLGCALSSPTISGCWVAGSLLQPEIVARMGQVSGPLIWHIKSLFASDAATFELDEALGLLAREAAAAGAIHLNCRVEEDSPVLVAAQRAGFVQSRTEFLYHLLVGERPRDGSVESAAMDLGLRRRIASDDMAIFRLYSAGTPVEVRTHAGMTFDEWISGIESPSQAAQEYVLEGEGQIEAWIRIFDSETTRYFEIMVHPESHGSVPQLLECVVAGSGNKIATTMVPEYAVSTITALELKGFQGRGTYHSLVRTMAKRVVQPAAAVVTIN